jgi:hypothetical protein
VSWEITGRLLLDEYVWQSSVYVLQQLHEMLNVVKSHQDILF